MSWTVYILKCADNTLYTGITNNLAKRIATHEGNKGAKYTRGRGPFEILYSETLESRSLATKREAEIKSWGRPEKMKLIKTAKAAR